jgi:hypothetical protein
MNILEAEDLIKGIPDNVLFQYAQNPPPQIPQFLAISEVQRRQDMRQRFTAQQQKQQQPTVKDQILQGGIASAAPPMGPPSAPPMGQPMAPQMPPQAPPMAAGQRPPMMSAGGIVPGPVRMQEGRTVPTLSPDEFLRLSRPGGAKYQFGRAAAPSAAPVAAPVAAPQNQAQGIMALIPEIMNSVQPYMGGGGGGNAALLEAGRPSREDSFNPEYDARRAEQIAALREMGEARKAEDLARAQRYLSEAEAPITASQEEARKAAIASTLMRLGAGVASGDAAAGLASATGAVEDIMGRSRQEATAERRAARQNFMAAEAQATQTGRSAEDAIFAMEAQNLTNDENKQQQFARDMRAFSQWAYGQSVEAGRSAQQAKSDSVRLAVGIAQSIQSSILDQTKDSNISDRQFSQTFSSVYREVLDTLKNSDKVDESGNPVLNEEGQAVPYTAQEVLELASKKTTELLASQGIISQSNIVNIEGQDYAFPSVEVANEYKRQQRQLGIK